MAKGKSQNPADAARKAARKKELKKNKEARQKTRDFALVKKDTTEIEDEISELQGVSEPSKDQKARLSELKNELEHIQKKKEAYVAEHPEQRNLVYRRKHDRPKDAERGLHAAEDAAAKEKTKRNLFKKNGLPRHPERSIYYDSIMNPYGMPPPGMPYQERALLPGEANSDAEDGGMDDSDDDIAMPEGPPPGHDGEAESDDDDIPLPEGPPPDSIPLPNLAPPLPSGLPPLPVGPPPSIVPINPVAPPMPPQFSPGMPPYPPFLGTPPFPPQNFMAPPPPGFFPPNQSTRMLSASAMQDPLAGLPHQSFQGYRTNRASSSPAQRPPQTSPSLPPPPSSLPSKPKPPPSSDATVSAEPELRDFKKENTMFVPAALKRKKGAGAGRVNAAPSADADVDGAEDPAQSDPRPDLMGALRDKLGPMADASQGGREIGSVVKKQKIEKPKDDYDRFMEEIGGMLDPGVST